MSSRRTALGPVLAASVLLGCGAPPTPAAPSPPSLPPPKLVSGSLDARVVLADMPARAVRLGAGPGRVIVAGQVLEGERGGGFVEVPTDMCLLGYARGSSSIDDLDVTVFAEEGHPLAGDERNDPQPTILLCPPIPRRVYVAVHILSGQGLVALAAHLVPQARAAELGRGLGARGRREGERVAASGWPGLDERILGHKAELGGRFEELRRVALPVDARSVSALPFAVEEATCVDALAFPDDEVGALEMEAVDDAGRILARAREGGRSRVLTLCSPSALAASLTVRPHSGSGNVAVVLSRARGDAARDAATRANVAWSAAPISLEAARGVRERELAKAAYPPAVSMESGALSLGRRSAVSLRMPVQAGCNRVDVVAGAPLGLIDATAWHGSHVLSASDGIGAAALFVCGKPRADLELETRGRPGPFAVLVRPEPWQSPVFLKWPLAAARMLGRATSGAFALHEGRAQAVRAVHLDAGVRDVVTRELAAGQCLRVAVGVEGAGTGIELRLFDGRGEEIDRSAAESAAAARACADATQSREVRVELRATAGALDAVVGERLSVAPP